jgi:hypothetical protein
MGYAPLDGIIGVGGCLCEAFGVGKNKNEQGYGYPDAGEVKPGHCCFALLWISLLFFSRSDLV